MSDYFAESGYKFILAVGLLLSDNPRLKTVCAERGCIEIVLECLKQRKRSSSVCKWSLWALMVSECFLFIALAHAHSHSLFISLFLFLMLFLFILLFLILLLLECYYLLYQPFYISPSSSTLFSLFCSYFCFLFMILIGNGNYELKKVKLRYHFSLVKFTSHLHYLIAHHLQ